MKIINLFISFLFSRYTHTKKWEQKRAKKKGKKNAKNEEKKEKEEKRKEKDRHAFVTQIGRENKHLVRFLGASDVEASSAEGQYISAPRRILARLFACEN